MLFWQNVVEGKEKDRLFRGNNVSRVTQSWLILYLMTNWEATKNTQKSVLSGIQTPRSRFFHLLLGVWKPV